MGILPDSPGGCVQDRRFLNPGVIIPQYEEDPGIGRPKLGPQSEQFFYQEFVDEITVREIQGFMAVPPVRKQVASDEDGFGFLPQDRFKQFLVSAYPAMKIGDEENQRHGMNDTEKSTGRQPVASGSPPEEDG
jgi:hypothetical protein